MNQQDGETIDRGLACYLDLSGNVLRFSNAERHLEADLCNREQDQIRDLIAYLDWQRTKQIWLGPNEELTLRVAKLVLATWGE